MKHKLIVSILSITLGISLIGNIYQSITSYHTNKYSTAMASSITSLTDSIASLESTIAARDEELSNLTKQISELQLTVETYENQKEKYWTLAVDDYQISLQEGTSENTLDLVCFKDNAETTLLTFQHDYDYQTPLDISAEAFEECLGHSGFRLYKRHPLGSLSHYYEVDYYAMEEELELLAYRWGSKDDDFYEVDLNGDDIEELICNVTWMADGAMDVLIYHFNGEKVMKGYGSDLLDEPFDNHGVGSTGTRYLPKTNQVHISYWQDAIQGFAEKDYEINLRTLKMDEVIE